MKKQMLPEVENDAERQCVIVIIQTKNPENHLRAFCLCKRGIFRN